MLYLSPFITLYCTVLAGILGAVMGSFLNCAAWRTVHKEPIRRGRSHCALCGHVLSGKDLIPLVSWLGLRGKCRYCGKPISPRYPLAELAGALLYVSVLLRFDLSWECLRMLYLLSWLLYGALVDWEDFWIPDRVPLAGALGFFPLALLSGGWALVLRGLIGAAALFLPVLLIVLVMEKILKTEAMGGGDLKLLALLGLYFGWQQGLFLVLVSCILGLVLQAAAGRLKKRTQTPFGPALSLAAWVTALAGGPVIEWYLGLFH